ncbi:hypothetical protein MHYP_G00149830 [Metynnis hypsauchen]
MGTGAWGMPPEGLRPRRTPAEAFHYQTWPLGHSNPRSRKLLHLHAPIVKDLKSLVLLSRVRAQGGAEDNQSC